MKPRRLLFVAAILAVASFGGATSASAHTLVDPTTLTPPLKPFRVCYEDGPWVKCDTSGPTETYTNVEQPDFGLPCGSLYESATITSHATRWYVNGFLVNGTRQRTVPAPGASRLQDQGRRLRSPATRARTRPFPCRATSPARLRSFTAASLSSRPSEQGSTMRASIYPMGPNTGTPRSPTRPRPSSANS